MTLRVPARQWRGSALARRIDEAREVGKWRRQVEVAETRDRGAGVVQPGTHRGALPAVGASQQADAVMRHWCFALQHLDELRRPVGAAVVDEDQLASRRLACDEFHELAGEPFEPLAFVVQRHHNGDPGVGERFGDRLYISARRGRPSPRLRAEHRLFHAHRPSWIPAWPCCPANRAPPFA